MYFSELQGRKVLSIGINASKDGLLINTGDGPYYLAIMGDCCSTSWIEHVQNSDSMPGSVITSVEHIELGDDWIGEPCFSNVIRTYKVVFHLENRVPFEFEMRNESNGCYEGYVTVYAPDDITDNSYLRAVTNPKLFKTLVDF